MRSLVERHDPLIRRLCATVLAAALALGPAAALRVAAVTVANPDSYAGFEDEPLVVPAPGVLGNDTSDAGTRCVTAVNATGLQGSLGAGVAADGSFTFTPFTDWNGETSFTYTAGAYTSGSCPVVGDSLPATVTITVTPVNDAPTAVLAGTCDGGVSVAEDSGPFTDPGHCTELSEVGPADEANQSLVSWVVSTNRPELFSSGPSISVDDGSFGRLAFTPAPNAHGSATVTVRGRDSGGTANGGVDLSPALAFNVTITSVNDAPTATADSFIVLADRTLTVGAPGVLRNDGDIDGDPLTAVKVTSPAHGVVTLAADGGFSYTPATGYRGLDAFSYRASDGSATSPARIVTFTVTAVPIPSPTPIPTEVPPTSEPTPEPTVAEASPPPSIEPAATLEPGLSAAPTGPASAGATVEPGATPVPGSAAGSGGGLPLPALLLIVLLAVLLAFGAAMYVPRWLNRVRTGRPPDDWA